MINNYTENLILTLEQLAPIIISDQMLFEDKPVSAGLPRTFGGELKLEELEEQILESLYRDIDKINQRIKLPRER
jgi:hypothetical protein